MTIQDFLLTYPLEPDFGAEVRTFVEEMHTGLAKNSSLQMIPTYVRPDRLSSEKGRIIAMDAGGTNLRITLVNIAEQGNPEIEYMQVYPMPGTQGELAKDVFFDRLAECLAPVADKSDRIGFCFSFPCEMHPNLDGKILHLNKEVRVSDIDGAYLCEELRAAMARKNLPNRHRIAVINDSVATLLGAMLCANGRPYSGYIGFILGTGTNCCYIEQNRNITKDTALCAQQGTMLINMESGGYAKAPRTKVDDVFDASTLTPGNQLFEKMISGAYQGSLLLAYIRQAADCGCFSPEFCARLKEVSQLASKEVDAFCFFPYGENKLAALTAGSPQDQQALYTLLDKFFDRAAIFTVINLAAIMQKCGIGGNPLEPVCICAEGTTFYKSKLLHEKIIYYMVELVQRKMHLYSEFVRVENANILGSALAAMQEE